VDFDPSAIRKLEKVSGYKILRSQVAFFGLCPDCRKENV
jgi:Fe2+ or Zn2+ uptake regulation protein